MALLILRTRPRANLGLSAFEMLYGMPYRIEKPQTNVLIRDQAVNEYISKLSEHRNKLWRQGLVVQRPPLDLKIHKIEPGDWVLVKTWKEETLKPLSCATYYRDSDSNFGTGMDPCESY